MVDVLGPTLGELNPFAVPVRQIESHQMLLEDLKPTQIERSLGEAPQLIGQVRRRRSDRSFDLRLLAIGGALFHRRSL
jgi:hypothetical protein